MKMKSLIWLIAILPLCGSWIHPVPAPKAYGKVYYESTSTPVSDVAVVFSAVAFNSVQTVLTDNTGYFSIISLSHGLYSVTVYANCCGAIGYEAIIDVENDHYYKFYVPEVPCASPCNAF